MIQSDLLYLSPLSLEDEDLFVEIYTNPLIMEHVGPVLNQQACLKMFNQCLKQFTSEKPTNRMYVIKSKQNHQKFGIIGLLWNQSENDSAELGVMIAQPFINKAYAYKATGLLMQYCFSKIDLKSIIILCNETNLVANRAIKAIGFNRIGSIFDIKINLRKIKWEISQNRFNKLYRN